MYAHTISSYPAYFSHLYIAVIVNILTKTHMKYIILLLLGKIFSDMNVSSQSTADFSGANSLLL